MQGKDEKSFEDQFTDCRIWFDYEGSDHCPVWADLRPLAPLPKAAKPPPLDARNRQSSTGAVMAQEPIHSPYQANGLAFNMSANDASAQTVPTDMPCQPTL